MSGGNVCEANLDASELWMESGGLSDRPLAAGNAVQDKVELHDDWHAFPICIHPCTGGLCGRL